LITATDEKDLWARFKRDGDAAAREELIVNYMGVVRFVAGRMAIHIPPTIDLDDLVGWGVLGLLDAVEKFDPGQDIKFSTYATIRIRGAILDEIRSLDWAPRSLRAMARKIGNARDTLRHQQGAEPSDEAVADAVGLPVAQVEETMAQLQTAQVLALDDYLPREDREEARKARLIQDPAGKSPETEALAAERQEKLVSEILQLPDQQQKVLNLYYYEELTLKEIGAVLDVSESRICQIHGAALKRLRQVVRGDI
jgi:RNA polymerase sigma factor for flagellar operon FliA